MAEETEATVMTPISPTEAGAPPKVSPFGASPAASSPAAPSPASSSSAAPSPAASSPAATPPPPAPEDAPTVVKVAPSSPSASSGPEAAPAAAAPAAAGTPQTIRLKPVIRKPMIRKPMAPAARPTAAPVQKKAATGNLKSVTGPIPAQAILKKTGIVAEGILTPAQAQASKSKTTRISLESAIGVAPAKEAPAPLKTIRLRRPTDLKPAGSSPSPLSPITPASTKAEEPVAPIGEQPTLVRPNLSAGVDTAAETKVDDSQKKTLKLHRPGISVKRPTLGIKKPGASASEPAAATSDDGVAELPPTTLNNDVPELKPLTAADFGGSPDKALSAGVPKWVMTLSIITSLAALAVIGVVAFLLIQEGCGPDAGANAMAFIETN